MEEIDKEVEETEEVDEVDETDDTTDWKAIALRNAGIAKRNATRLEKFKKASAKIETPVEKKVENKKESFDYAEKAFLKSNNISKDEFEFVLKAMQSSGKSLDDILESKYFQSELKELRETTASKDAIPTGTKRAGVPSRDTVEYHTAKGTPLDQIEDRQLRINVLNARIKTEESKSQFDD